MVCSRRTRRQRKSSRKNTRRQRRVNRKVMYGGVEETIYCSDACEKGTEQSPNHEMGDVVSKMQATYKCKKCGKVCKNA